MFAEHCEEGGEKCGGETGVEDGLDLDNRMRSPGSLWEGGNVVSKGGVVDLVDKDTEESDSLITRVGMKLRLDIEDESRGDCGEQTGL